MIETFQDGSPVGFTMTYPVTLDNFPPPGAGENLSYLVNPSIGDDHGLARPTFPGEDGYLEELFEVIAVRKSVLRGDMPEWFFARYNISTDLAAPIKEEVAFTADLLGVSEAEALADLVRMDSPTDLGRLLIRWLAGQGITAFHDTDGHVPFLQTHSQSLELVGMCVSKALKAVFEAKYYFGRPRPAEVARSLEPNLDEGVFSQYPHPRHPAYPAGHGAASGATVAAILAHFHLQPHHRQVVENAAKQFAMARTHAGMHYANDNLVGYDLGFAVASEQAQTYHA